MNTLQDIAASVASLARLEEPPTELADGTHHCAELDAARSVVVFFNPSSREWVVRARMDLARYAESARASLCEQMLRATHDRTLRDGVVGLLDGDGMASLSLVMARLPADPEEVAQLLEGLFRQLEAFGDEGGEGVVMPPSAAVAAVPDGWLRG